MALTRKQGAWLAGGGLVALYLWQKHQIDQAISTGQGGEANNGTGGVPLGVEGADAAMADSVTIKVKLTRYYAYDENGQATSTTGIEGGSKDRLGNPLYSLDQYNRGEASYVSLSGDDQAFPYGQRVAIDAFPDVLFRVVDTGGSFSSASRMYNKVRKVPLQIAGVAITTYGKLYRMAGYEPIDVCSDPDGTKVPNTALLTIYPGDDFASQNPSGVQSLNYSKFRSDVTGQVPQGSSGDTQVADNSEYTDPSQSEFSGDASVA